MIFEMRASDLPEILDMERQYFGRMAWNPSDFTSALDSAYDLPLVFREEGRTIAYSVLRILGPEAEIENLCVLESARRRGIGAMLLDQMLALSLERGVSYVYLEVREGNLPARRLYEGRGFLRERVRRDYYRYPSEDGIVMRKELKKG